MLLKFCWPDVPRTLDVRTSDVFMGLGSFVQVQKHFGSRPANARGQFRASETPTANLRFAQALVQCARQRRERLVKRDQQVIKEAW